MTERLIQTDQFLEQAFPEERARLVNLAARLTGSPDVAEDLAQEALMEAWRSRSKLVQPEGASRWLSVITRNVSLRWLRAQGRATEQGFSPSAGDDDLDELAGEVPDLEIELERSELAELLDRAMAQLPPETRTALVERYVHELPQAEIAARLGLSEGAVEARLQRGKLSLHRLLVNDYRPDAQALGLAAGGSSEWVQTRMWCPICGQHHLYGTLPSATGQFELHCPSCSWSPRHYFAQSTMIPDFASVKGYRATLKRFMAYIERLFGPRRTAQAIPCSRCGFPVPIQYELPSSVPVYPHRERQGIYLLCPRCGSSSYSDIYGLALNLAAGQRFWQEHPRMRSLPARQIELDGCPALELRFESLADRAAYEVVFSKDRYLELAVRVGPGG